MNKQARVCVGLIFGRLKSPMPNTMAKEKSPYFLNSWYLFGNKVILWGKSGVLLRPVWVTSVLLWGASGDCLYCLAVLLEFESLRSHFGVRMFGVTLKSLRSYCVKLLKNSGINLGSFGNYFAMVGKIYFPRRTVWKCPGRGCLEAAGIPALEFGVVDVASRKCCWYY